MPLQLAAGASNWVPQQKPLKRFILENFDSTLYAISALDGRYHRKVKELATFVSEAALIKRRIHVELAWLLFLSEQTMLADDLALEPKLRDQLQKFMESIPDEAVLRVKAIEQSTNHDVKAVEYYIRELLKTLDAPEKLGAFLHFACTSEDINNLSYALILRDCRQQVLQPLVTEIEDTLFAKAQQYAAVPMLSRTHGQPASPTSLGKELAVFVHRLAKHRKRFAELEIEGKINGAVGNFNAHHCAYPELDWPALACEFVEQRLQLSYNPITTQIENHDSMVQMVSIVCDINTLLIGLTRDMWSYISIDYFRLAVKAGEVGSSTMPHKVNPIDFENAEGNLGVANGLGRHLIDKLPISRWQRDLSDSTVQRSLGTFFGHSVLAYKSLLAGLAKVEANESAIEADLANCWEVLAEAVQTVMRRYGVVDAYERLKAATRGQKITHAALQTLIQETIELPPAEKQRLLALRPEGYLGLAESLVQQLSR